MISPGYDDIHVKNVKRRSKIISPFLEYIINRSFKEGIFPERLQVAKVVPIFNKGSRSLHSNYRPASILSSFSKIFEKVVVNRVVNYLSKFSLLTKYQYGFRPNYNTELAVHQYSIYNSSDKKEYQVTIFCDFSKAFDTISHPILLEKLQVFGFRGPVLAWFKSYLNSRKQYIVYDNFPCSQTPIYCGVPQGSMLGPILFSIYINNIIRCSNNLKYLFYDDDTILYMEAKNLYVLQKKVNTELQ